MSSYTRTNSRSYTYANVRYINDKILADLEYILALFPEVFTRKRLEGWKNDFYQWMIDGYASAINIQFLRDDECFYEITYEIRDDGTFHVDDAVGKIRANLEGATTYVRVDTTAKWDALTDEAKRAFYQTLDLDWGPAAKTNYASGLYRVSDKQYSSGAFGAQRSILGG